MLVMDMLNTKFVFCFGHYRPFSDSLIYHSMERTGVINYMDDGCIPFRCSGFTALVSGIIEVINYTCAFPGMKSQWFFPVAVSENVVLEKASLWCETQEWIFRVCPFVFACPPLSYKGVIWTHRRMHNYACTNLTILTGIVYVTGCQKCQSKTVTHVLYL